MSDLIYITLLTVAASLMAQLPAAYVLGPDDQIALQAPDIEEISAKPVRIDLGGAINLHLSTLLLRELSDDHVDERSRRDDLRDFVFFAEVFGVASDQVVGLGSFCALIEAIVGFVFGNLERAGGIHQRACTCDDGEGICDSCCIELQARPTEHFFVFRQHRRRNKRQNSSVGRQNPRWRPKGLSRSGWQTPRRWYRLPL